MSKFGYFKQLEKVRIKLQWLRKLAAEKIQFLAKLVEEMKIKLFLAIKKSSPGKMGRWVDGWMDGRMDGWMYGWMGGCKSR